MSRTVLSALAITLATSVAGAGIVEFTSSGTFYKRSTGFARADDGWDLEGREWSVNISYDTNDLFGSPVLTAELTIDGTTYSSQVATDNVESVAGFGNYNEQNLPGSVVTPGSPGDPLASDRVGFSFSFGDSFDLVITARANPSWWEFVDGGAGSDPSAVPQNYDLTDFFLVDGWFSTRPDNLEFADPLLAPRRLAGQWGLEVDTFSGRAVPTPAGLIALGGMGLLAARRRR